MKNFKRFAAVMIVLAIIGLVFYFVAVSFQNPQQVEEFINEFGAWGPLIVILLITLEVILAPIPGAIISIGAGAAYGYIWGTIYTYIGNIIGSSIAFMLSRHFGRPLVRKLIREKQLATYDAFVKDKGIYGLWIAYMFPVFPVDIISFVTGLSGLRYKKFLKIIGIAFIPNMLILNLFGDKLSSTGFSTITILIAAFLGLVFIFGFMYMLRYRQD